MEIKKILKDIVIKFGKENIDFTLIGAFALLKFGIERGTRDIDFMIHDDDLKKVKKIMQELTYEPIQISKTFSQFESPLKAFGNIDFLHVSGEVGKRMLDSSLKENFLGSTLKIVRPEDLIGLKVLAYSNDPERSKKDKADIYSLYEAYLSGNIELDLNKIKFYYVMFDKIKDFNELWLKGK